ncbi:PHD finger protein 11 [Rhinophrynus dorsalis]
MPREPSFTNAELGILVHYMDKYLPDRLRDRVDSAFRRRVLERIACKMQRSTGITRTRRQILWRWSDLKRRESRLLQIFRAGPEPPRRSSTTSSPGPQLPTHHRSLQPTSAPEGVSCTERLTQTGAAEVSSADPENRDSFFPDMDVSKKVDLFLQYKTTENKMFNSGLQAGVAKRFWSTCQENNCLQFLLTNIKCTIKLIEQKILSGEAVDQDYEQAFTYLWGSRCLEDIFLNEKQEIQSRLQTLDKEREHLHKTNTLLANILQEPE